MVELDGYLDGIIDGHVRQQCEAGENMCDGCEPDWEAQEPVTTESASPSNYAVRVTDDGEDEMSDHGVRVMDDGEDHETSDDSVGMRDDGEDDETSDDSAVYR